MLNIINRNIILPAYLRWKKDRRLERLKDIKKFQWLSNDEIADYQFKSFQSILNYAYMHVPFYRKKYKAHGVSPADIRTPTDIEKLPILTKKDVKENLTEMLSDAYSLERGYQDASGGSTGQPTIFWGDKSTVYMKFAAILLTDSWTGWRIGERSAYIWGADREVNRMRNLKEKIVQNYIFRRDMLNAFCITEEDMEGFSHKLLKEKPPLIVAYTNAIYSFAQYLNERSVEGILPKGIVCSAETLTEEKRKTIRETFHCKVLNRYGSREVGLIASECEAENGLHVNANDVYVELKPINSLNNTNNLGEVIVTDFNNYVMPFIRYNMGDLAVPLNRKCTCGRGLPMIGSINGRTSDFIVHPNGSLIHGEFFSHAFYGIRGITQYQIIQDNMDMLKINIVPNEFLTAEDNAKIKSRLQDILGEGLHLALFEVDTIPISESGKYRFAISNVKKKT